VALGNVVGSNIANILLILGLSAAILPIVVTSRVIRFDVPLMIAVSLGFGALALDGRVSRLDGLVLLAGIGAYTWWNAREGRAGDTTLAASPGEKRSLTTIVALIAGLGALWLGGRWFVDGAVALARTWGLSELVIGLTVVALGTSLPEAATSVVASVRGERDLAVGNVVGSNVFNLLAVMGAAALVAPEGITVAPTVLRFDIPVMIAAAVVCLPVVFTGAVVARWEGVLLIGYYAAYTGFVVLSARGATLAPLFGRIMLYFVVPLTVVTLTALSIAAWRRHHR
jgi:cation:H+ antiporter